LRFWNNEVLKNPEDLHRGHPHPDPPPSRGRA
jgi:hypothetical protein